MAATLISEAAIKKDKNNIDKAMANISGSYMGLLSFTFSFGPAIANILLAFIFTGSNRSNRIIIITIFASIAFFFIISIYFLKKIQFDKIKLEIQEKY